jgi:hypothetical protein
MDPTFVLQASGESGSLVAAIFVFLVSLVIGTVGIHTGARLVVDTDTGYRRATVTALVGALIWALMSFFLGWIPILGPVLMLVAWVGVINWQYPGGWLSAAGIGLVAWLVAFLILYALGAIGIFELSAIGIPGA